MDRNTPVRKPHTSTADLLTWSEIPPEYSPATAYRSHQPSDGIRNAVFGGQVTDEEVESLNKRKPCSGYKMKEMTGSGIFKDRENGETQNEDSTNKTGLRMYQQALGGVSHISFGEEETITPKKPPSLAEVAKQRELSGHHLESECDATLKKQFSNAKNKELSGNDIFAPPPEIQPRPLAARALALRETITMGEPTSHNDAGIQPNGDVKTSKKIPNQKVSELSGYNFFKGGANSASTDKPLSSAKLREMNGSDIFADGKAESRDFLGGVRKPPGGESSIALV